MFGIGMPEMILILALALIVFGPKKLPDLAKSLGRALGEFKKAANDFKESISLDDTLNEVKKDFREIKEKVREPFDMTSTPGDTASDADSSSEAGKADSEDAAGHTKETEEPVLDEPEKDQPAAEGEKAADSDTPLKSDDVSPGAAAPQEGPLKDA